MCCQQFTAIFILHFPPISPNRLVPLHDCGSTLHRFGMIDTRWHIALTKTYQEFSQAIPIQAIPISFPPIFLFF